MAKRQRGRHVHGIVLVDKPLNLSSNQVLQRVKRLYNANKAGHAGSLDPLATGMLPISLGEATKFSAHVLDADKVYEVEGCLGITTTSGDGEGDILDRRPVPPHWRRQLTEWLPSFLGTQMQHAPLYSALKHNGKPLYEYARRGIEVERKVREIEIFQIQLLSHAEHRFRIRVHCSKGTYIRTLVEDIGSALGCGAYVTLLRREWVSPFQGQAMVSLDSLERLQAVSGCEALDQRLLGPDAAQRHLPAQCVDAQALERFLNGLPVTVTDANHTDSEQMLRLFFKQHFIGLGLLAQGGQLAPKRMMAVEILKSLA